MISSPPVIESNTSSGHVCDNFLYDGLKGEVLYFYLLEHSSSCKMKSSTLNKSKTATFPLKLDYLYKSWRLLLYALEKMDRNTHPTLSRSLQSIQPIIIILAYLYRMPNGDGNASVRLRRRHRPGSK